MSESTLAEVVEGWVQEVADAYCPNHPAEYGGCVDCSPQAEAVAEIVVERLRAWLQADEQVEKAARALAELSGPEPWPSNEALGGGPTGTRDDEYRDAMREDAAHVLAAVAGDDDA